MSYSKIKAKKWELLLLATVIGIVALFCAITPNLKTVEVIYPDLYTNSNAASSIARRSDDDQGLFWMKFKLAPQIFGPDTLNLRTWGCLNSLTTNTQEWNLPEEGGLRCYNSRGLVLRHTSETLKSGAEWAISGDTDERTFGVSLEKEWSDPLVVSLLVALFGTLGALLLRTLPLPTMSQKIFATVVLLGALGVRFFFVFIVHPPQTGLWSDMGGYFVRATEILNGIFYESQNFQPVGFTFWSLVVRWLGGWELHNWMQVFASWGTTLLIFIIVVENFGVIAALFALVLSSVHFPQISFAAYHLAECTYTFLLTLSLWWLLRTLKNEKFWKFFVVGMLLMVSFYFKGNHAFFIPLFCFWYLLRNRRDFSKTFVNVTAMALGCLLFLVPHMIWTAKVYGKPMAGPTAGALNFVEGKCPSKNNRDSTGMSWMSPLFAQTGETLKKTWDHPFTDQKYFWKAGLDCVKADPAVMFKSFRYIYYLFLGNELWPGGFNDAFSFYYQPWKLFFMYALLPLSLLGWLLLSRERSDSQSVLFMLLLSVFITVYVFKSENRFRAPFDAVLLVWSSYGLQWLYLKAAEMLKPGPIATQESVLALSESISE